MTSGGGILSTLPPIVLVVWFHIVLAGSAGVLSPVPVVVHQRQPLRHEEAGQPGGKGD